MSDQQSPRTAADYNITLQRIPYAQFLGISIAAHEDDFITRMAFTEKLIGNPVLPALHGGVIGAFLEMTALIQLVIETQPLKLPKPVDITIDYLRTGRPMDTFGRATITRHGRRVANVQAVAWQNDPDRPIAMAHGHFLLKVDEKTSR